MEPGYYHPVVGFRCPHEITALKLRDIVLNEQYATRYIKQRMGDDLKNKIHERHGIKIANKQTQMVSRTCGRCDYVNKLESKFCERHGCNYPLTQLAFEERKKQEESRLTEIVNERESKDQEINELKEQMAKMRSYEKAFDTSHIRDNSYSKRIR